MEELADQQKYIRESLVTRTVEFHKYQMMEKLDLHTNAELVHFAIKHHCCDLGGAAGW